MSGPVFPTINQLLRRMAISFGDREAVVDGGTRWSFAQTAARAWRLGHALRARGFQPGDRIGFIGDNSAACLEAYLGLPAAGLVLMPLNTRLAAAEIRSVLEDSGAGGMIIGKGYEERVCDAAAGLDVKLIGIASELGAGLYEDLIASGKETMAHTPDVSDTAYMYYTSGSTGRPKGVMLTHSNVMAGGLGAAASCAIAGHHTWLHAGPMFHLADAFAIWASFWLGTKQICMRFSPDEAVRLIETESVTHTLGVPTVVDMLCEAASKANTRLPGLQAFFYGGAPMPAPIYERSRALLDCPLVATYGMTETTGIITCGFPGEASVASGVNIVGREAPLTELQILNDDGKPVSPGDVGEITVTSAAVTKGYWRRQEETAAVLSGSTLKTGDLGARMPDGNIALIDRKKDMIISGGENVYSREVELALEQHEMVLEAAVVAAPDEKWGETVCAFIKTRDGAPVDLESVQAFARTRLAGYKIPRRVECLAELPRTGSGKVSKPDLRQLAARSVAGQMSSKQEKA
jgi:acyl-CoA synthetase (AMP-forming)/AMP-acid ligase II